MLLRLQFRVAPVSSHFSPPRNQLSNDLAPSAASNQSNSHLRFRPTSSRIFLRREKPLVVSCKSSHGGSSSWNRDDGEFLQAFVLTSGSNRSFSFSLDLPMTV
ncbi:hypothetical protein ACLOJK_018158 [Asimina triloba]